MYKIIVSYQHSLWNKSHDRGGCWDPHYPWKRNYLFITIMKPKNGDESQKSRQKSINNP